MNQLVQYWWVLAVRGLAAVIFGILALFYPGITFVTLVMFFGAFALVDGVFTLIAAIRRSDREYHWVLLLQAIAGIAFGIVALVAPLSTAIAVVYLVAAWCIVTGVLEVMVAIRLRKDIEGEWLLGLSGVLSIVLGIAFAALPLEAMVALTWMLGAYAIAAGIILMTLGFKLRKFAHPQHTARPAVHH